MGKFRAIPTLYKSTLYRSRCEAKWAVFFDALGWKHVYEPEGFDLGPLGYYLPDFWIDHVMSSMDDYWKGWGFWFEIKGTDASEEEYQKLLTVCAETGHNGYMLQGYPDREYTADKIQVAHHDKPRVYRDHGLRWTAINGRDHLQAACLAAGSARFEHGQRGPTEGYYEHAVR